MYAGCIIVIVIIITTIIVVNPLTCHLNVTYDFWNSFIHFSTTLWNLPNSMPVHSMMLFCRLFVHLFFFPLALCCILSTVECFRLTDVQPLMCTLFTHCRPWSTRMATYCRGRWRRSFSMSCPPPSTILMWVSHLLNNQHELYTYSLLVLFWSIISMD